jgi:P-type Ca2+ transporter type 2C
MVYVIAVHVPIFGMSLIPVFVPGWPLVLLPVQIAVLELVIDPACTVVFESEQIDPQIMNQQPRAAGEPMFSKQVLTIAALQGLSVLLAALGIYLWAVLSSRPDKVTRSITFTALLVGNLSLILVNRSWRLSIWRSFRERQNPTLKWILAAASILLVLFLTVPVLRANFRFGPMTPGEWVVAVAAGFIGVSWFEIYKTRLRR